MRRELRLLLAGAFLAYFFDPQSGRRRRDETRDRVLAFFRRVFRRSQRSARGIAADADALKAKATHLREQPKALSDEALAQKVMSEAFRDQDMPKGTVNVNVERGRVILRGEVDRPELVEELELRVRKVMGVRDVTNHVHVRAGGPPGASGAV